MSKPGRALLLLMVLVCAATLAALGPTSPALAHTELLHWEVQGPTPEHPQRLLLRFSEPIDGRFLTVDISGRSGMKSPAVSVDPQRRTDGFVDISGLPAGTYSVAWWTRAVDGDPSNGSFSLGLGAAADPAALLPPVGARDPATQPPLFYGDTVWNTIIHWLIYLGTALLMGSIGFGLLIWRRALLKHDVALGDTHFGASGAAAAAGSDEPRSTAPPLSWVDARVTGRLRLVAIAGGALFLFANVMLLLMQIELIRYAILQPVTAVAPTPLAPSALSHEAAYRSAADIFQGYNGMVWIARMVLGATALGLSFRLTKSAASQPRRWIVALAATLAAAVTVSLTAHAAVVPQSPYAVALDWTHLTAMSLWLGGLVPLFLALREFRMNAQFGGDLPRAVVRGFSTMALVAVVWLAATGLFGAYLHVRNPSLLVPTTYGRALIAKLVLFAALVTLGVVHRRVSIPRLARDRPGRASTLERILPVEIVVGGSLLVTVALMMSLATSVSAWSAHEALGLSSRTSTGEVSVTFRAAPGSAGKNAIGLDVADRRPGPPTMTEQVTLAIAGRTYALTPDGDLVPGSVQRFVCPELVDLPEGKSEAAYTIVRPSYPEVTGTITLDVAPASASTAWSPVWTPTNAVLEPLTGLRVADELPALVLWPDVDSGIPGFREHRLDLFDGAAPEMQA